MEMALLRASANVLCHRQFMSGENLPWTLSTGVHTGSGQLSFGGCTDEHYKLARCAVLHRWMGRLVNRWVEGWFSPRWEQACELARSNGDANHCLERTIRLILFVRSDDNCQKMRVCDVVERPLLDCGTNIRLSGRDGDALSR